MLRPSDPLHALIAMRDTLECCRLPAFVVSMLVSDSVATVLRLSVILKVKKRFWQLSATSWTLQTSARWESFCSGWESCCDHCKREVSEEEGRELAKDRGSNQRNLGFLSLAVLSCFRQELGVLFLETSAKRGLRGSVALAALRCA